MSHSKRKRNYTMALSRRNVITTATLGLGLTAYPATAFAKPPKAITPEEITTIEAVFGKKGKL